MHLIGLRLATGKWVRNCAHIPAHGNVFSEPKLVVNLGIQIYQYFCTTVLGSSWVHGRGGVYFVPMLRPTLWVFVGAPTLRVCWFRFALLHCAFYLFA